MKLTINILLVLLYVLLVFQCFVFFVFQGSGHNIPTETNLFFGGIILITILIIFILKFILKKISKKEQIKPDGREVIDPVGPGYYSSYKTTRTIGFGLRHPIIALRIGDVTHNSTNISTNSTRFAINTGLPENDTNEGSHINAFRHVLWQAEITERFGSDIAKQVGNAHEENPYAATGSNLQMTFTSLADADQTIDLLNNQIGRKIGNETKGMTMQERALAVLEYFNANGLWTAIPNVDRDGTITTWSVARTVLTGDQYNNAKATLSTTNNNGYTPAQQAERNAEIRAEAETARKRAEAIQGPKF